MNKREIKRVIRRILDRTADTNMEVGSRLLIGEYGKTKNIRLSSNLQVSTGELLLRPEDVDELIDVLTVFKEQLAKYGWEGANTFSAPEEDINFDEPEESQPTINRP
jgi:hypothetical protein